MTRLRRTGSAYGYHNASLEAADGEEIARLRRENDELRGALRTATGMDSSAAEYADRVIPGRRCAHDRTHTESAVVPAGTRYTLTITDEATGEVRTVRHLTEAAAADVAALPVRESENVVPVPRDMT